MGVTDSKKAKQKETSHEVFPRGAVAIGLAAVVVGCRESRSRALVRGTVLQLTGMAKDVSLCCFQEPLEILKPFFSSRKQAHNDGNYTSN